MRRTLGLVVWIVALALAANAGRLYYQRFLVARGPAETGGTGAAPPIAGRVVPYTVALSEVMLLKGQQLPGMFKMYAQRRDGAFVERIESASGLSVTIDRQVLLLDRIIFANDLLRRYSELKRKVPLATTLRDPSSECLRSYSGRLIRAGETKQGIETIAGRRTVRIDSRGLSQWFATDLGCAMLQQRMQTSQVEVSEQSLVYAIAGDPDDSLFQVSVDYVRAAHKDLNTRPAPH